jgi:hypothetical protein
LPAQSEKTDPLTYDQSAVLAILFARFPTLAASHNRGELVSFVVGENISPYDAALFDGWLNLHEREFSFMKVSFFKELWEEFSLVRSRGRKEASQRCSEEVEEIYKDWENRDFDPDDVAA